MNGTATLTIPPRVRLDGFQLPDHDALLVLAHRGQRQHSTQNPRIDMVYSSGRRMRG